MRLNILVDENIPAVEHFLTGLARITRVNGRALQSSELQDVDALLVRSVTQVNASLLRGSKVKFVGTATSGVDHIDQGYLSQHGIGFAHAPGSNANSVVEYVLAAIARVEGKFERLLDGGSVGIVGYGVIGKALAARLSALRIDYLVYDPWLDQQTVSHPGSLHDILACDVVSLHAELTRQQPWPSFHLLQASELACLRPETLLINASRGPVVDNDALLTLLQTGQGPITVLDVWEGEPRLQQALLDQVLLGSAHIAGYSLDGKLLATRMLCTAMASHFGLVLPHQDSPAGTLPALLVPDDCSGTDLLRYLLRARYDIACDDALLRDVTLGHDTVQAGLAFDLLRKTYRDRHELLGSTVQGNLQSPGDIALVAGLGCIAVTTGTTL
ncbi:MAG: 4-phosphoerythronate dehydrogenase [Halioglobus sp.]